MSHKKTCFQRGFEFIKKNAICQEKICLQIKIWNCYKTKICYKI